MMEVPVSHLAAASGPASQLVVRDEDITIGGNEIEARGASDIIFRTYKPIQIIEYYGKHRGWHVTHDMRSNAQAHGAADGNIFTMEVIDSKTKQVKYQFRVAVSNKVQGRVRAALGILIQIFGKNQKWLDLVEKTKQDIEEARQKRGAPERPVFKKAEDYL